MVVHLVPGLRARRRRAVVGGALAQEATALLRLRLDIAALRRQAPSVGFDAETHGAPVSQFDLCHTLVLVDRVALRGIKSLGGKISDEEDQSWSQRWRHAGRFLGVHEFLLPTSADEAQQAYEAITASLRPTPQAKVLTDALPRKADEIEAMMAQKAS